MRDIFIDYLFKKAKSNKKIILIVGDVGFRVVDKFEKKFPKRFFNAGVSEQNMVTMAAGLASEGYLVFIYSIANFTIFRAAEQIRNDVDYHKLPVIIVSVGAGLSYGNLGYSHHMIQDFGIIRLMPNMKIVAPCDKHELEGSLEGIIKNPSPTFIRLGGSQKNIYTKPKLLIKELLFNKIINDSSSKLILCTGQIVSFALALKEKNFKNFSIFSCPVWGQSYKNQALNFLSKWKEILVVEEHLVDCGFYSWILEILNSKDLLKKIKIKSFSLSNTIIGKVGSKDYLDKLGGLRT